MSDSPLYGHPRISASIERRENVFLRWVVGAGMGVIVVLGGIVWGRTADQVSENTKIIRDHALSIQRLELDAASDRRANSVQLSTIQAWLQAIGTRLNVAQPPPGVNP